MALTFTVQQRENITRVVATGVPTGTTETVTIFGRPNPATPPPGGHVSEERVAVKIIRLVGTNTVAGDYFQLTDLGTVAPAPPSIGGAEAVQILYEFMATGDNFVDSVNFGDDLRNGLILNVISGSAGNDAKAGSVFVLYLYHLAR